MSAGLLTYCNMSAVAWAWSAKGQGKPVRFARLSSPQHVRRQDGVALFGKEPALHEDDQNMSTMYSLVIAAPSMLDMQFNCLSLTARVKQTAHENFEILRFIG
jgi:hypothetical protein